MPDTFIIRTCPYCEARRMTFDLISKKQYREKKPIYELFLVCRRCERGIVAMAIDISGRIGTGQSYGDLEKYGDDIRIGDIRPGSTRVAPDHVSEEVSSEYQEAASNLKQGNLRSAGMVFRHTLERATKELAEQESLSVNNTLFERINLLHTEGLLTDAIKDWAHHIRLIGNETAHEMRSFEKEEIEDAKEFTEMFLLYAFTLPERVRQAREKTNSPNS